MRSEAIVVAPVRARAEDDRARLGFELGSDTFYGSLARIGGNATSTGLVGNVGENLRIGARLSQSFSLGAMGGYQWLSVENSTSYASGTAISITVSASAWEVGVFGRYLAQFGIFEVGILSGALYGHVASSLTGVSAVDSATASVTVHYFVLPVTPVIAFHVTRGFEIGPAVPLEIWVPLASSTSVPGVSLSPGVMMHWGVGITLNSTF